MPLSMQAENNSLSVQLTTNKNEAERNPSEVEPLPINVWSAWLFDYIVVHVPFRPPRLAVNVMKRVNLATTAIAFLIQRAVSCLKFGVAVLLPSVCSAF